MTTILYGKDTPKMEEVRVTLLSNEKRDILVESEGPVAKSSGQGIGCQNNKGDKKTHGRTFFKSREQDNHCHYGK